MFNAVDCLDAFQNVLNGIIDRILSGFNSKTFMSHILKSSYFFYNFFLSKFFAGNMLIFFMIRTVHTAVYAIVGKIQRGKQNDSVSVEFFLDLRCQIIHILNLLRNGTGKKDRGFSVGKSFTFFCLRKDLVDQLHIFFVCICICKGFSDLFVGNKFLCF